MTTKDDGGPAFPSEPKRMQVSPGGAMVAIGHDGMTLRDWFAGQAMAGLLANQQAYPFGMSFHEPTAATIAYRAADAMLAERSK